MAVNPKGYVPALRLDDGSILTEGPAIVQYLADSKPASGLAPAAGTIDRYRLQKWLTFIGTELHKSFSPLFNRASSDDVQLAGRESTYHRNYRFKVDALLLIENPR
jgi:glutathione S-transferase